MRKRYPVVLFLLPFIAICGLDSGFGRLQRIIVAGSRSQPILSVESACVRGRFCASGMLGSAAGTCVFSNKLLEGDLFSESVLVECVAQPC